VTKSLRAPPSSDDTSITSCNVHTTCEASDCLHAVQGGNINALGYNLNKKGTSKLRLSSFFVEEL